MDGQFRHEPLGMVTGTEKEAMDQLLEVAIEGARRLITPSKGCQVAQEGTSIVVSPVKRGWSEVHYQEYRLTAVPLMTVQPSEKARG